MQNINEVKKKIILLGDGAVGKTSLIRKFVVDKFDDNYLQTVGFKITQKELQMKVDGQPHFLKLSIWDILGQKGYIELHKSSLPGTAGVILVADITRKDTLISIDKYWIPNIFNMVGSVPVVILANKMDLAAKAEFKEDELKRFASKYDAPHFLTSAKTGKNVKEAFYTLGKTLLTLNGTGVPKPLRAGILEVEKSGIAELIDKIITDFCKAYGRPEDAMPVLRKQFELAKLDLNHPELDAIREVVNRLAGVEVSFKGTDTADANRTKRLKWIKEYKENDGGPK